MLKKLLKYEFKSVSKTLVPLLLGTLVLAIITAALFTVNYRFLGDSSVSNTVRTIYNVSIGTLLVFSIIAIIASIFVLFVILLNRYYKNFFGDEGYLTFTLPAQIKQHLFTKLVSGVVWSIIGGIVVAFSIFLLAAFGTAENGEIMNSEILDGISYVFNEAFDAVGATNFILYIIEFIIMILVSASFQLLVYYLAITIGSIIAKKHKIIVSIGVYLGISSITGMIMNILITIIGVSGNWELNTLDSIFTASHIGLTAIILINATLAVIAFIINNALLSKKLNLE